MRCGVRPCPPCGALTSLPSLLLLARSQSACAAYRVENKEKSKKRADAGKKRKAADKGSGEQQEQGEQQDGGEAMEADAAGDDAS